MNDPYHSKEGEESVPEDDSPVFQSSEEDASPPSNSEPTPSNDDSSASEKSDGEESMEAEVMKWKDAALRATAELDNFRKRMAREKSEAIRYGVQSLLFDILPVIDNFDMGMIAAEKDADSMVYKGMTMVRQQLNDFLANQGVTLVSTDIAFDPNLHEALSHQETTEHSEGSILQTTRNGYLLHDRLLRPANVIVAKAIAPTTESNPEPAT